QEVHDRLGAAGHPPAGEPLSGKRAVRLAVAGRGFWWFVGLLRGRGPAEGRGGGQPAVAEIGPSAVLCRGTEAGGVCRCGKPFEVLLEEDEHVLRRFEDSGPLQARPELPPELLLPEQADSQAVTVVQG